MSNKVVSAGGLMIVNLRASCYCCNPSRSSDLSFYVFASRYLLQLLVVVQKRSPAHLPSLNEPHVEVSTGRSSGAPAEAPECMNLHVQVPYNV